MNEKPVEGVDFYLNEQGYRVFTEVYLLKRSFCCKSNPKCLNCPYRCSKKTYLKKVEDLKKTYGDEIFELYKNKTMYKIYEIFHKKISKKNINNILKSYDVKITQKKNINSGINNGMSKLTPQNITDIRKEYADGGISYKKLGLKYSMSASQIGHIILRKSYKSI